MKKKILVVDDAKSVANHIQSLLTPLYTAKAVYSGEAALETIPSFMPDLILLDTIMTGMNGHEVCRKIRQDPACSFIKIIMISSRKKLEERIMGYEAGIDDHLGKPFEPEELLAKVKVFLRLKSVEDQLRELNLKLNDQVSIRTAQLVDAEKMAALGRHAAGIIHNLNNPLQAVLGLADVLSVSYPEDATVLALETAALQMKEIIGTILTTSRKQNQEHMVSIDLNQVIREQLSLLKPNPFFRYHVQTETHLDEIPLLKGIYTHFSQSIANLLKNAVEAMHGGRDGRLSVSTGFANDEISVMVEDTGPGIKEKHMAKLFDPFFSTKPLVSEDDTPTGTGLGLAYCKEIIESYGGSIRVRSQLNQGSCFTIRIPTSKNQNTIEGA